MKKRLFTISLIVICLCSCLVSTSCKKNKNKIESIEILKDTVNVDELDVYVGDEFTLKSQINNDFKAEVIWNSSDPKVISIDNSGNVKALKNGTVIITVSVKDSPFITDSIYITATEKVHQLGVGSGLSKEDPIFLGNEGEEEPLEIYFIEMQQIYGDSLFIKKGNVEILIDSGYEYDGKFVNKVITQYCTDGRLDLLMATHSDGDHIDGLANALKTVDNVSLMIDYGGTGGGNILSARKKYTALGMQYHSALDCVNHANGASDIYYLTEELYFEVLNTGNYISSDKAKAGNGNSVAVIFYYKEFSFFTAGDLTNSSEAQLLRNETLPEVTLYKASHHGSHGSNSQELLDTLNPKGVAISASIAGSYGVTPSGPNPNNTYNLNAASGHPAAAAIERIYKAPNISQNLNVYWNGVNGTMKFTTYGENGFTFTGSKTMKGYYNLTLTGGVAVWNAELNDFENRITGEENLRLHETKVFEFRNYIQYLPDWAKQEYYPDYN